MMDEEGKSSIDPSVDRDVNGNSVLPPIEECNLQSTREKRSRLSTQSAATIRFDEIYEEDESSIDNDEQDKEMELEENPSYFDEGKRKSVRRHPSGVIEFNYLFSNNSPNNSSNISINNLNPLHTRSADPELVDNLIDVSVPSPISVHNSNHSINPANSPSLKHQKNSLIRELRVQFCEKTGSNEFIEYQYDPNSKQICPEEPHDQDGSEDLGKDETWRDIDPDMDNDSKEVTTKHMAMDGMDWKGLSPNISHRSIFELSQLPMSPILFPMEDDLRKGHPMDSSHRCPFGMNDSEVTDGTDAEQSQTATTPATAALKQSDECNQSRSILTTSYITTTDDANENERSPWTHSSSSSSSSSIIAWHNQPLHPIDLHHAKPILSQLIHPPPPPPDSSYKGSDPSNATPRLVMMIDFMERVLDILFITFCLILSIMESIALFVTIASPPPSSSSSSSSSSRRSYRQIIHLFLWCCLLPIRGWIHWNALILKWTVRFYLHLTFASMRWVVKILSHGIRILWIDQR